ncbi:hypothetical protein D9613_004831 [Agrocybe pediades]|uniref:Uncharacterized protein n=1 Tax=Agrocybe pediades TaxID=84607 RepID=A0A8H4VRT5_9AGAR|nr:hypothetical protein D9613_004831 [Agrocybe pediades]
MNVQETSRPPTPGSPLSSSLYHATSTIDDLTAALADFSRVPSPEPVSALTCCCGKEDCENLKAWLDRKSRLGSRLVLSAEVGQALLQRHAAYVRETERKQQVDDEAFSVDRSRTTSQINIEEDLHNEIDHLTKEKTQLEKRLNQALVNNEVTEVSNKTILQELQEAREMISRLTAHHARSVGWDTRLSAAMKERDDMQQERDGETHRARLAESRFAALKEKTAKLQAEVRRLQQNLEEKRNSRLEFSKTVLQDAKSRLDSFKNAQLGLSAKVGEEQLTHVLESLVQDNEVLKHDNAELQHLLAESREDLHALQEEVEEQRALNPPSRSGASTPYSRHFHSGSVPSLTFKDFVAKGRRNASTEGRSRRRSTPHSIDVHMNIEPLTPDTARSPLSFTESLGPSGNKWNAFGQLSPQLSHVSYEVEQDTVQEGDFEDFEKPRNHKPLLLLHRSRGTQTDYNRLGELTPSPLPSQLSSVEQRSETSSYSESHSSHVSIILERFAALLNRMTQADALTLTNRLKRQHLKGADVGHLSRSTVSNIMSEATGLRAQFRAILEDEKVVSTCTRKDLRNLFKLIKDVFTEMGALRVTLNDVVLDPSSAPRISESVLNPGKAEAEKRERERESALQGGVAGWIAPISKLFSPTGRVEPGAGERSTLARSHSLNVGRDTARPPRFVPKLGPALAASATTVNVEFSGSGVGRSVTSTFSAAAPLPPTESLMDVSMSSQGASAGLMGIFAGAPAPRPVDNDPWVVLPSQPSASTSNQTLRKSTSFIKPADSSISTATIGRNNGRKAASNRLSRNVDAVIDVERPADIDEEPDFLPPLLERTLRRRGLSDSSIHSTFTSHGEEPKSPGSPPSPKRISAIHPATPSSRLPGWADRTSMFQVLSRTVQNLRSSTALTTTSQSPATPTRAPGSGEDTSASSSRPTTTLAPKADLPTQTDSQPSSQPSTPRKVIPSKPIRVVTPSRGTIMPNLTAWAASSMVFDPASNTDPFIAGSSVRDESFIPHERGTSGAAPHGREFY